MAIGNQIRTFAILGGGVLLGAVMAFVLVLAALFVFDSFGIEPLPRYVGGFWLVAFVIVILAMLRSRYQA